MRTYLGALMGIVVVAASLLTACCSGWKEPLSSSPAVGGEKCAHPHHTTIMHDGPWQVITVGKGTDCLPLGWEQLATE